MKAASLSRRTNSLPKGTKCFPQGQRLAGWLPSLFSITRRQYLVALLSWTFGRELCSAFQPRDPEPLHKAANVDQMTNKDSILLKALEGSIQKMKPKRRRQMIGERVPPTSFHCHSHSPAVCGQQPSVTYDCRDEGDTHGV